MKSGRAWATYIFHMWKSTLKESVILYVGYKSRTGFPLICPLQPRYFVLSLKPGIEFAFFDRIKSMILKVPAVGTSSLGKSVRKGNCGARAFLSWFCFLGGKCPERWACLKKFVGMLPKPTDLWRNHEKSSSASRQGAAKDDVGEPTGEFSFRCAFFLGTEGQKGCGENVCQTMSNPKSHPFTGDSSQSRTLRPYSIRSESKTSDRYPVHLKWPRSADPAGPFSDFSFCSDQILDDLAGAAAAHCILLGCRSRAALGLSVVVVESANRILEGQFVFGIMRRDGGRLRSVFISMKFWVDGQKFPSRSWRPNHHPEGQTIHPSTSCSSHCNVPGVSLCQHLRVGQRNGMVPVSQIVIFVGLWKLQKYQWWIWNLVKLGPEVWEHPWMFRLKFVSLWY